MIKDHILNLKGIYNKIKKDNLFYKFDKKLYEEKKNSFPKFFLEEIERESNYWQKNKFSKKAIDITVKNLLEKFPDKRCNFVRVKIIDNKLYIQNYLKAKFHPRFVRFENFFKKALQNIKFEDVDFLYTILDSFDEPSWLECLKAPMFCISKKENNNKVILFPHIEWMQKNDSLIDQIKKKSNEIGFDNKINKAFWVGSSTGNFLDINQNERYKIVKLSKKHPDLIKANFSYFSEWTKKDRINFLKENKLTRSITPIDQIKYKYLFSIDGNAFAGSFFWQVFSNCLILKNKSSYLEWYYPFLKKNEHFFEYEKEEEILSFLKDMNKANENKATLMIKNSNDFSGKYLNNENILAYISELFKNYSFLKDHYVI
jgi:hypothetical protein